MNPRITDWEGRRVWLGGASTGIGAALAPDLHGRGARLALSARDPGKLAALGLAGATLAPCDATDGTALATARTTVLRAMAGLDLVVYLAGDYVPMTADNFDLATAERVVEINFLGAMRLAHTVLTDILPRGGMN